MHDPATDRATDRVRTVVPSTGATTVRTRSVAPVDGTADGERALALADVAARRLGATLELFHVVRPSPPLTVDPPLVTPTADAAAAPPARPSGRRR